MLVGTVRGAGRSGARPRVLQVGKPNATFQHLEVLKRSRAHRRRYGEVFVEGVRPIQRLLEAGWPVRAVCSEAGRALSPWAESVLATSRTPLHQVLAPELMA